MVSVTGRGRAGLRAVHEAVHEQVGLALVAEAGLEAAQRRGGTGGQRLKPHSLAGGAAPCGVTSQGAATGSSLGPPRRSGRVAVKRHKRTKRRLASRVACFQQRAPDVAVPEQLAQLLARLLQVLHCPFRCLLLLEAVEAKSQQRMQRRGPGRRAQGDGA